MYLTKNGTAESPRIKLDGLPFSVIIGSGTNIEEESSNALGK